MTVGTIVRLMTPMLGEELHAVGVVFYDYGDGCQVMFMDGGYDGFSESEQKDYLQEIGFDERTADYRFRNVMQVSDDYESGMWNHVYNDKRYRKTNHF
jgi:hypothetical protein